MWVVEDVLWNIPAVALACAVFLCGHVVVE